MIDDKEKEIIKHIRGYHNLPDNITDDTIRNMYKNSYLWGSLNLSYEIGKLKKEICKAICGDKNIT